MYYIKWDKWSNFLTEFYVIKLNRLTKKKEQKHWNDIGRWTVQLVAHYNAIIPSLWIQMTLVKLLVEINNIYHMTYPRI